MNNGFIIYPTNKKQLNYIDKPSKRRVQASLISQSAISNEIGLKINEQAIALENAANIFNEDDLISSQDIEKQRYSSEREQRVRFHEDVYNNN
jgi:hypothetical protein